MFFTFDVMLDIEMLMKFAPASVATAFASIVFPVPGGPNRSMPLQGCKKIIKLEFSFRNSVIQAHAVLVVESTDKACIAFYYGKLEAEQELGQFCNQGIF